MQENMHWPFHFSYSHHSTNNQEFHLYFVFKHFSTLKGESTLKFRSYCCIIYIECKREFGINSRNLILGVRYTITAEDPGSNSSCSSHSGKISSMSHGLLVTAPTQVGTKQRMQRRSHNPSSLIDGIHDIEQVTCPP